LTTKKHILLENKKVFGNLEISDDLGFMNWHEAVEVCKKLGKGWRLPTKDELNFLYENKEEIGGLTMRGVRISSRVPRSTTISTTQATCVLFGLLNNLSI
jgi:hypothetical protein